MLNPEAAKGQGSECSAATNARRTILSKWFNVPGFQLCSDRLLCAAQGPSH